MPDALGLALRYAPKAVALFNAAIFLDSLRYKFADHPKTQQIFGRLDGWAGSIGFPGLFGHTGVFSQYVIGGAEFIASVCLLVGAFHAPYRFLLPVGALLGLAIMSGAVSFHLFTPLGIDPNNDGAGLFRAACMVWIFSLVVLFLRTGDLQLLARRIAGLVAPA